MKIVKNVVLGLGALLFAASAFGQGITTGTITGTVTDAYTQLGEPVLVDDTGLTVHAWNGLPGALVAWFLDTVGAQGILNMATGLTDRRATVTTALGYADADGVQVFTGTVNGTLANEPRGTSGFGYDAIFHTAFAKASADQDQRNPDDVEVRHRAGCAKLDEAPDRSEGHGDNGPTDEGPDKQNPLKFIAQPGNH